MSSQRMPVLFLSHGGGPWPYIEDMRKAFAGTEKALRALPASLPEKPKAIVVISGHWEEAEFTIGTSAKPPMIYDYSGFPEHTYHIEYPAPGSPAIAKRVSELLSANQIKCETDADHGFDHGIFVPLVLMYPDASIPIIPMSLKLGYDPAEHLRMGEALRPLRDEGVLIIGSGLTYHNLRAFGPRGSTVSVEFEKWLTDAVTNMSREEREQALRDWESKAPSARLAHPQEDHLLPLMVAAGAAGEDPGRRLFVDQVFGITMSSYAFGTAGANGADNASA